MKASKLIKQIQAQIETHGDREVVYMTREGIEREAEILASEDYIEDGAYHDMDNRIVFEISSS